MTDFIKQRKLNSKKKKNSNELEALVPINTSLNEILCNNNQNNFDNSKHDIQDEYNLNNENLGVKVTKKNFDTCEKFNINYGSANINFSLPINSTSINKTNNRINICNKSGNMSFMKSIYELGI